MDARDSIRQAGLPLLPAGTPITIVGSRDGYAVAVGPADRPRWLHTTAGQFKTFTTLDRATALLRACGITRFTVATALLRACGITRFTVDTAGGTPQ